jgi:methylmalonyl-CoA mutase cobalamin-binding domain/chain
MRKRILTAFSEAIYDTDRVRALEMIHRALADGVTPEEVVFEVIIPGIEQMMTSGDDGFEANLAQHFMAAQIAAEVTDELVPRFRRRPEITGRVVIGTAWGDFHGLGKRIVIGCLKAHLIEVIDLGLNVYPERFVEAALAADAEVIGISSMMVNTARGELGCLGVRRLLRERGLEGQIKIIVGGAPYRHDDKLFEVVQADAWAVNGVAACGVVANLIREVRS